MTDTSKLIPGEYYWVKLFKNSKWEASEAELSENKKRIIFQCKGYVSPVTVDNLHAIDSDTEGNPIPIKRPE